MTFADLDDTFLMGLPIAMTLAYYGAYYVEEAGVIGLDVQPMKSAALFLAWVTFQLLRGWDATGGACQEDAGGVAGSAAGSLQGGVAARKVEESKVVPYGDVHPQQLVPFSVEVYGGSGLGAMPGQMLVVVHRAGRRGVSGGMDPTRIVMTEGAPREEVERFALMNRACEDVIEASDYDSQVRVWKTRGNRQEWENHPAAESQGVDIAEAWSPQVSVGASRPRAAQPSKQQPCLIT
ncbi:hypothetical protein CYMTET_18108 [Cymbomonas tetramitiformis]|uniref:Uncharacterized protein n=1 Tax=Cymbomonas tetramitiformis TaxID=36881 RepID=A0AAE0L689_9CHLO|nr:hypothetical protein CYMTET_18108 [Cymbomonas tetramitiformis]